MLRSIFENILASVICALILAGIKRFLNYLKTPYEAPTKQSHPPKSLVRTQFLISLRSVYKELHADHETGAADNK